MNTELKVSSKLNGLARRLVDENIPDLASLEAACLQASKNNRSLLSCLISSTDAAPNFLVPSTCRSF